MFYSKGLSPLHTEGSKTAFFLPQSSGFIQTKSIVDNRSQKQLSSKPKNCSKHQIKIIKTATNAALQMVRKVIAVLGSKPLHPAFNKHFGSPQNLNIVVSRYKHIQSNLPNKNFICSPICDPSFIQSGGNGEIEGGIDIPTGQYNNHGQGSNSICALAPCSGNTIILCPDFFRGQGIIEKLFGGGCPQPQTLIHESAHNAGACLDIPPSSKNYPSPNAVNNAWSYEGFASDV